MIFRRAPLGQLMVVVGVVLGLMDRMEPSTVVLGFTLHCSTTRHSRRLSARSRFHTLSSSITGTTCTRTSTGSRLNASSNTNELIPLRRGSAVALVTPFDALTGHIDEPSLRRLFQYHLEAGTDNLCLLGTTAEAAVLSMAERQRVLTIATDEIKGRIPIMVGCGTINPTSIQSMVQQAMDCGADAALIVTPYYVKPPQRSLVKHFVDAAGYGLPVIIYNVPSRTGVDMTDASIATAAIAHEGIVAVKDATGKLERVANLRQHLSQHRAEGSNRNLLLYSGDDATSMDFCLAGGDGCISVTANVAARAMRDIMAAALSGNASRARDLNAPLMALHDELFCEANPIPVKYALSKLDLIRSPFCRPPLDALDGSYHTVVEAALHQASLVRLPNA